MQKLPPIVSATADAPIHMTYHMAAVDPSAPARTRYIALDANIALDAYIVLAA